LDGQSVATLAATNHSVALVLRLVDEMLAGDEEIDWERPTRPWRSSSKVSTVVD